jgi:replicative DNA helicase
MSEARYHAAADILDAWRDDVLSGTPPVVYPIGEAFEHVEVGPGLVTLIGGAPGAGKTSLVLQWLFEALRLTPTLRALVCNVEMSPAVLLDRQLARLADLDASIIRHRRIGAEHNIDRGLAELEAVADRLAFVRPPFDLSNVARSADDFEAGLIVLDYIQRIPPPGEHSDRRGSVDATMGYLRQFADAGTAIVVVAALARSKDAKGRSSYGGDALSLASFRETSELEYGADDALIVAPAADDQTVTLKHLKSRHGETRDITLRFDRPRQRFEATASTAPTPAQSGKLHAALRALWNQATPSDDEAW